MFLALQHLTTWCLSTTAYAPPVRGTAGTSWPARSISTVPTLSANCPSRPLVRVAKMTSPKPSHATPTPYRLALLEHCNCQPAISDRQAEVHRACRGHLPRIICPDTVCVVELKEMKRFEDVLEGLLDQKLHRQVAKQRIAVAVCGHISSGLLA